MYSIIVPISISEAIKFEINSEVELQESIWVDYLYNEAVNFKLISEIKIFVRERYEHKLIRSNRDFEGCQPSVFEPFPGDYYTILDKENRRIVEGFDKNLLVFCYYNPGDLEKYKIPISIEICLVKRGGSVSPERVILRILRDIVYFLLHRNGYILVHGSLVTYKGRGMAFLAPKNGGKSTWLLYSLKNGRDYVANDRFFFNANENHAIAFPIAALIHKDFFISLPHMLRAKIKDSLIVRSDHKRIGYAKVGLTPRELADAYNVRYKIETSLKEICLLSDDKENNSISLDNLRPKELEAEILNSIYTPSDPTYKFGIYVRGILDFTPIDILKSINLRCRICRLKFSRNFISEEFISYAVNYWE